MSEIAPATLSQGADSAACQTFSIASDLVYSNDSRFDATSYAKEAKLALSAILATRVVCARLQDICGKIWHPVQNQARDRTVPCTRE